MTELERKQSTCVPGKKKKKSQPTKNVTNWRPVQSGWFENICSQRMREGHGKRRNEEGRKQLCKPQAALHVLPSLPSLADAYLGVMSVTCR